MPLTDAALQAGTNGITAAYPYVALHSADPGATGLNEVTAAGRLAANWGAATGSGDASLAAAINFSGMAANQAVTYVGLWDSSVAGAGNFGGGFALTGDQAANTAGDYTVSSLTVNATAT